MSSLNPADGPWLIWSIYHNCWHRKSVDAGKEHATGYTDDIAEAGVFGAVTAGQYDDPEGPDRRDRAVPLREVLPKLADRRRKAKAQHREAALRLELAEQSVARASLKDLTGHRLTILEVLIDGYAEEEWRAYNFAGLVRRTGLTREQVQRACRGLRSLGFAKMEIGLWSDEGEPCGSGYRCTEEGFEYLRARHPEAIAA